MRCCNCQRQLFQSASGTSAQNPRPADRNSLRVVRDECDGGSSLASAELSLCICSFRFGQRTIDLIKRLSSGAVARQGLTKPKWLDCSVLRIVNFFQGVCSGGSHYYAQVQNDDSCLNGCVSVTSGSSSAFCRRLTAAWPPRGGSRCCCVACCRRCSPSRWVAWSAL